MIAHRQCLGTTEQIVDQDMDEIVYSTIRGKVTDDQLRQAFCISINGSDNQFHLFLQLFIEMEAN